jgi:hypothetical protein
MSSSNIPHLPGGDEFSIYAPLGKEGGREKRREKGNVEEIARKKKLRANTQGHY